MIYEKNLEILKCRFTDIYDAVTGMEAEPGEVSAFVETAKNGDKIVRYVKNGEEFYLNSRYNPCKEAEKFMAEDVDMPDESVLTMVGLSNGSFVREFINKNDKNVCCVIFEPDASIFMQVIKNIDISDTLSDERVLIVVDGMNTDMFTVYLSKLIQIYNRNTNRHIVLPKYSTIFGDTCDGVERVINEQYDRLKAETDTLTAFGMKTCINSIMNMRYLPGCRSGADYAGRFPGDLPVIIVSAGPSLEKNIEALKKAKGKALIVAVDTAILKLRRRSITPDMIISVDYNKSLRHFKYEGIAEVPFLAEMDTNTAVLDYVKPESIIFNSSDSLVWDKLFAAEGSRMWEVETGGSVSTAAIAHMISWGFKKIIMVGQDLALTGNKVHADEKENSADKVKWATTYVEGIDGEDILTRKDYCMYIRWIENLGGMFDDIELIDATEGGALKKNTTVMSLSDAIDKYCKNEYDIGQIIRAVPRLFDGDRKELITEALTRMKNNLRNMRKLMISGAADCHRGSLMLSRGDYNVKELKRITASIGRLDKLLLECDERSYISKYASHADVGLADDMYFEERDDIKESIRMYDKSEAYYKEIADGIPEIIKMIDECTDKMSAGK